MKLYTYEKSIRILYKWSKRGYHREAHWTLAGNTGARSGAYVMLENVSEIVKWKTFYGTSERHALHKAAKWIEEEGHI